jgi:hypothetical protein
VKDASNVNATVDEAERICCANQRDISSSLPECDRKSFRALVRTLRSELQHSRASAALFLGDFNANFSYVLQIELILQRRQVFVEGFQIPDPKLMP